MLALMSAEILRPSFYIEQCGSIYYIVPGAVINIQRIIRKEQI